MASNDVVQNYLHAVPLVPNFRSVTATTSNHNGTEVEPMVVVSGTYQSSHPLWVPYLLELLVWFTQLPTRRRVDQLKFFLFVM